MYNYKTFLGSKYKAVLRKHLILTTIILITVLNTEGKMNAGMEFIQMPSLKQVSCFQFS